jgi:hypothetical protein
VEFVEDLVDLDDDLGSESVRTWLRAESLACGAVMV